MYSKVKGLTYAVEYTILVAVIIFIWYLLEQNGTINPVTLPGPDVIFKTFIDMVTDGSLMQHLKVSIIRVLKGYFVSAFFGIILGIVLGLSKRLSRMTDLLIQILKPIPPIAWIPLVILWFGIGEMSKVFLIFLGGFFTILIDVIDGIHQTDSKLIEVAKVMETPKIKYIFELVIPSATPYIFTGLRIGISSCWMCVVAAELVASTSGIGYMIMNARQFCQTDVVIVGMIAIGVTGKLMDVLLKLVEKKATVWCS
jgi:sulfonate transport system permease protein